jgi:hypothetical protein
VFDILEFDPEKQSGTFGVINNTTDLNFTYTESTGVLTSLGSNSGSVGEQLTEAVTQTNGSGKVNSAMSAVVDQLANPNAGKVTSTDDVVLSGGGNLIASLASAAPEEREAVFARFTPEGYGGAYEYAFRSLMVNDGLFDGVTTSGSASWAELSYGYHKMGTESSTTQSDYEQTFNATGARVGLRSELLTFGIGLQIVNGGHSVGGVMSSDAKGTQLQLGAMLNQVGGGFTPYATFESGSQELSGRRTALASNTKFDDVESKAQIFRLGTKYQTSLGQGALSVDGSVMAGKVHALSFSETGGQLNDRLTVDIPDQNVSGASLSVAYHLPVSDSLSMNADFSIDHVSGLNDYDISSSVGNETITFDTGVPGYDSTQGALSVGADFKPQEGIALSVTGFANGVIGDKGYGGASVKLKLDF